MQNALFLSLLVGLFAGSAPGQTPSAPSGSSDDVNTRVIAAMTAIRAANAAGDAERWDSLVSSSCEFVEPSGHFASRRWHRPSAPSTGSASNVGLSEMSVNVLGDSAILSYREDMKTQFGDRTIASATRFAEVYQRRNGAWQLVFSSETPIVEKKPVNVPLGLYDDYVGEYQMAPGLVGRVYRESDRLLLIGTGWKQAYELLPMGRDTFFVKEMPNNEISFVRDSSGKVVAQVGGTAKQEITGKKIK